MHSQQVRDKTPFLAKKGHFFTPVLFREASPLQAIVVNHFVNMIHKNLYSDGNKFNKMVKILEPGVELKKVDEQGRFILPSDWRESELGETREVYVIKRKGFLKLVPKRRVDLTKLFDKVDLGVESIEDWTQFEQTFYGENL